MTEHLNSNQAETEHTTLKQKRQRKKKSDPTAVTDASEQSLSADEEVDENQLAFDIDD